MFHLTVFGVTREEEVKVQMAEADMMSQHRFTYKLGVALRDNPDYESTYNSATGFLALRGVVFRMAAPVEVAEMGTTRGVVKATIRKKLNEPRALQPRVPTDRGDFHLGFIDQAHELIYVNPGVLVRSLNAELTPNPRAELVWEAVRGLAVAERLRLARPPPHRAMEAATSGSWSS